MGHPILGGLAAIGIVALVLGVVWCIVEPFMHRTDDDHIYEDCA